MGITIDQQRQRVEHEITRMVDDLDKSAMRNMQVLYHVYFYLHHFDRSSVMNILLENSCRSMKTYTFQYFLERYAFMCRKML